LYGPGDSLKSTTSIRTILLGTDSLIDSFSFVGFSDIEIHRLFENIGFFLGTHEDIKINIINNFRTLLNSRFKKVVKDIQDKHSKELGKDKDLIYISKNILDYSL
jgi:hypothetical protein